MTRRYWKWGAERGPAMKRKQ